MLPQFYPPLPAVWAVRLNQPSAFCVWDTVSLSFFSSSSAQASYHYNTTNSPLGFTLTERSRLMRTCFSEHFTAKHYRALISLLMLVIKIMFRCFDNMSTFFSSVAVLISWRWKMHSFLSISHVFNYVVFRERTSVLQVIGWMGAVHLTLPQSLMIGFFLSFFLYALLVCGVN